MLLNSHYWSISTSKQLLILNVTGLFGTTLVFHTGRALSHTACAGLTLISCFNNLSCWWQLKVTIKRRPKVAEESRGEAIKAGASKRWVSKWVWRPLIETQYCFSGLHTFQCLISPSFPFNCPLSGNYIMCFPRHSLLQFLLLTSHKVTFKDALSSAGAGQSRPAAEHRPGGHTQVQMYPLL